VALLFRLGLALVLIGLLDLLYTRRKFGKDMMMSRREMKEEVKRREGDPLIRAKLRELQRENLKQAASVKRVPEADVLITNPEHLAIALKYQRGAMAAPVMLAKGADSWAADMRALARRHGIPIYERRPLARQLFRLGQLGQAIPADAYVEVARVYADLEAKQRGLAEYEVRP
jgi:flagellar biosynthesis protein FlhB